MKITKSEKDLILFLFEHKLETENKVKEYETVNYLNSLKDNYPKMFEATHEYHFDERLTHFEKYIVLGLYKKFN